MNTAARTRQEAAGGWLITACQQYAAAAFRPKQMVSRRTAAALVAELLLAPRQRSIWCN